MKNIFLALLLLTACETPRNKCEIAEVVGRGETLIWAIKEVNKINEQIKENGYVRIKMYDDNPTQVNRDSLMVSKGQLNVIIQVSAILTDSLQRWQTLSENYDDD